MAVNGLGRLKTLSLPIGCCLEGKPHPQWGELQNLAALRNVQKKYAPTPTGAATPNTRMPLPLRKANETLKGENSLSGNSGGKHQKSHRDRRK